jgi:hypothetical protein
METQVKRRMTSIKVMYNDDMAIIDFMADLKDRDPIKALDRFVKFSSRQRMCFLFSYPEDSLYMVLLYMAPLDFNEGDNKLVLFAYDNLGALYVYFEKWLGQTAESNKAVHSALKDILYIITQEIDKIFKSPGGSRR